MICIRNGWGTGVKISECAMILEIEQNQEIYVRCQVIVKVIKEGYEKKKNIEKNQFAFVLIQGLTPIMSYEISGT